MQLSTQRDFSAEEQSVWQDIVCQHRKKRGEQIVDLFENGLELLGIDESSIPNLEVINKKLKDLTGWQGVYVRGLEEGESFYPMLAEKKFPIGNFVRDRKDLSYTPEPDIIHDLYGHIPFYANKEYAKACHEFALTASRYKSKKEQFIQFERVFWFTYEFGLIETSKGLRIFGAGIASSTGECEYALSNGPEKVPFSVDVVRRQDFRIDEMQKKLFVLKNKEQLYQCLPELVRLVETSPL
ncbi:MAG: hypothetical protein KDD33_02935 [Bdellovibrionales bacterium]|nr:hypothetical protein [Bdellovibrionales bacterium]